jgi:hypothetical protein
MMFSGSLRHRLNGVATAKLDLLRSTIHSINQFFSVSKLHIEQLIWIGCIIRPEKRPRKGGPYERQAKYPEREAG